MSIRKLERISLQAAAEIVASMEAKYVNKMDFVDKGIEPKIKPVVIALVAHGFPTQNSCEGHLKANLYPWVRLEPDLKSKKKKHVLQHVRQIHYEIDQLDEFLYKFYQQDNTSADRELVAQHDWEPSRQSEVEVAEEYLEERARHFVAPPGYWLQCAGAEALLHIPSEIIGTLRKSILRNRQNDILNFSRLLVAHL